MELKLKPFDFAQAAARAGLQTDGQPLRNTQQVQPGGFAAAMSDALKSVSATQNEATRLQQEVQLDNPSVSIEQTMVAMQKAQIGFQATLTVRNRLVQAYTDIMGMQV
ncbi:flagellar hook-basal body complex protein FliE [Azohydromonas lata]|uniref:Flagellar hook-basal body complex protein FliE n=1 Tax=Azohydromonas lata TaxID=45677 RepID=A0ABU5INZ8_9BURK|nr:flagellar hook-basal body complex protein FliE [Azohydromonas lata]MDZ5460610.1 flagellar hook-basal body complex protein FliE [Azohydromonas lata]